MFDSERTFAGDAVNLAGLADAVLRHFSQQGYLTAAQPTAGGGWHLTLTKGGTVAALVGLRTILTIDLVPRPGAVYARAGAPGPTPQLIPIIAGVVLMFFTLCLWAPVLVLGIVGVVRQAKLDDEAMAFITHALPYLAAAPSVQPVVGPVADAAPPASCVQCGQSLPDGAFFCVQCGASRT